MSDPEAGSSRLDAEDAALIEAFLSGSPAAVGRVRTWLRQAGRPYRRRLASWEDTEQDVILELLRLFAGRRFRGASRLKTYLWAVVKSACMKALRSQDLRGRTGGSKDVKTVEAGVASPLQELIGTERARLWSRLLRSMPGECRRVWSLLGAGVRYPEISQRLDITPGALRVRVHRCRKKARALWAQWQEGQGRSRPARG